MKTHLIAALLFISAAPAFGQARIKPPALSNSMSSQFAHRICEYPSKYGSAIAALELKLRERRGGLANPNTIIFGIAY
jgi:hypothetical protein